ncbi:NAD(P)-binding Rossmann-fold superfamily protein [Striga asiatica]|uniref:NAD(P)-binding Rossmann-fold superfamily protein n=1 Tax=Striga asiatica TaxID=4170 RepID=A0A5A7PR04_STRAF|nr:NAD(P)-binding Rossmann-fold superfamily protein [Striga asiatica]
MYNLHRSQREEKQNSRSRKPPSDAPSFSSTLLDEIYRSIDGGPEDFTARRENPAGYRNKTNIIEDEDKASLRRACLVEKWIEKAAPKGNALNPAIDKNTDLIYFSSTSSSNSDSSGALSSSDTEFFASRPDPKVSCFSTRPKPVRTTGKSKNIYNNNDDEEDELMIKYKSRALKLYSNLKKVQTPISPGGRLTSLITSIFSGSANLKKSKNGRELEKPSRSCLSKDSPGSRGGGAHRTVRFHPVSVIVDQDSRPCGEKRTCGGGGGVARGKPPLPMVRPLGDELKLGKSEKNRKVEMGVRNERKGYIGHKTMDDFLGKINGRDHEDDDDDCDGISDSSSDLFELNHFAMFADDTFCEELPVYETTRLDTNRVITGRLILS